MAFTLDFDGDERPLDDARASELPGLIADVAGGRAEFLILTNDDTGAYIRSPPTRPSPPGGSSCA